MKNLIDYLKDKIYYVMAATVIILILLIMLGSCSSNSGTSYSKIEDKMKIAAQKYYSDRKDRLPKEENTSVQVSVGTLIESKLLKEIKDPKDKSNICEGYVQVKKVDNEYAYIPFLTCKGNYEPKYLTDVIKNSKLDEYGNGVYEMDGEYVYRGDDVNNYVKFNDQLWRIIKIDKDGDIKLLYYEEKPIIRSYWDNKYNSDIKRSYGLTSDYLRSSIRKRLVSFYDENFISKKNGEKDYKSYIVSKKICVGSMLLTDEYNISKECARIKEQEKIGLLVASDYGRASLDTKCTNLNSKECTNLNYLSDSSISTWLLTSVLDNTYEVFYLNNSISIVRANYNNNIMPVIFVSGDSMVRNGNGQYNTPYIIK